MSLGACVEFSTQAPCCCSGRMAFMRRFDEGGAAVSFQDSFSPNCTDEELRWNGIVLPAWPSPSKVGC